MKSFVAFPLLAITLFSASIFAPKLIHAATANQSTSTSPSGYVLHLTQPTQGNPNPGIDFSNQKIVVTNPLYAQSASTSAANQAQPDPNSCFSYYKFGSVTTTIQSQTPVTTAGVPLSLSAIITNTNQYPIVDGALYIKIFKKRADGQAVNGPDVVDEFFATDSMDLTAGASTRLNFIYGIPSWAQTGDYEVATFFTTSKKFNLSGLSFTDDVTGSLWDFSVRGGQPKTVEFDKDAVTVAGAPYLFASYPPTESHNEVINVSAPIENETGNGELVPVTWTLYSWDAQLASNIVATSSIQQILVPAHASTTASFIVPQNSDPVYLLVGEVDYRDTKSFINVRFVRQGVDIARLNFPSITSFPLKVGVPVTLFSCFSNSGLAPLIPPNTISLSLVSPSGGIIEKFSETLPVTGAMMLAKKVFTPNATYDNFTLKATLTDITGKVVDQVDIHYDCSAIDPKTCAPASHFLKTPLGMSLILLIILIALGGFGFYYYRYRKNK